MTSSTDVAGPGLAGPVPPPFVDAAGVPEDEWLPVLERLSPWTPGADAGRVVVVSPHPDDETLGVGGLLADLVERGWTALVVAVTDGEAAYGACSARARTVLAQRRRAEQAAALRALSPTAADGRITLVRLGLADGGLAGARSELVAALRPWLAGASWCLAPLPWDGHPDHEVCAAAAMEACGDTVPLDHYPIWAWHWVPPSGFPVDRAVRVALSPTAQARKAEALTWFGSQYEPVDGGAVVPPHVLVRFQRPFEVLVP